MIEFNLVLKIIISAILLYLVVNSIFRYHIYNDLFISLMVFSYLIIFIIYYDLSYNLTFLILMIIITVVFLGLYGFFKMKNIRLFWILNGNKQTYHRIRYFLKLNPPQTVKYSYDKKFFWLIKFFDGESGEVKKIMKGIEATETKRKKSFTMCNYWQIIVFLVIMVVIWRF